MRSTISAAGTTSSRRQPFVVPTSMYSMNRSVWPVPRKCAAISRIACSFRPRLITAFTFTGIPAAAAASIPSSTRCDGEVDVVHGAEGLVVERVQADGDTVEPRGRQRLSLRREQRRVRRQRELGAEGREHGDQPVDVLAYERLAAREPELLDAEADERRAPPARFPRRSAVPCGRGSDIRSRRPPSACSRRSGSCSGR